MVLTLTELNKRAIKAGFKYSYGVFKRPVEPPHLIGHVIDSDNFGADNKVYFEISPFQLELTTLSKDLELQKKVQNEILKDIFWRKSENYINVEEVYNTSYFFDIKEE